MKKLIYIMLSLCCLVFYSCGMTEPWKDWEHEGDMSADRLRPSEVKELLCAADENRRNGACPRCFRRTASP